MKVNGQHTRSIWVEPDGETVAVIDQRDALLHCQVAGKAPLDLGQKSPVDLLHDLQVPRK